MNPGVSPENFQVGMTVLIPPSNNANKENDKPETVFVHDKVEKAIRLNPFPKNMELQKIS